MFNFKVFHKPGFFFNLKYVFMVHLFLVLYVLVILFFLVILANQVYADCLYDGTCVKEPSFGKLVYISKDVPIDNPFDESLFNFQTINGKQCVEICYIEKREIYCKMYPIESYRIVINRIENTKQGITINDIDRMYAKIIAEYNKRIVS